MTIVAAATATATQTSTSTPHDMSSHISNKTTTPVNNLRITFFRSRDPGDLWWKLAGVTTKQGDFALVVQDIVFERTILCRKDVMGHMDL